MRSSNPTLFIDGRCGEGLTIWELSLTRLFMVDVPSISAAKFRMKFLLRSVSGSSDGIHKICLQFFDNNTPNPAQKLTLASMFLLLVQSLCFYFMYVLLFYLWASILCFILCSRKLFLLTKVICHPQNRDWCANFFNIGSFQPLSIWGMVDHDPLVSHPRFDYRLSVYGHGFFSHRPGDFYLSFRFC